MNGLGIRVLLVRLNMPYLTLYLMKIFIKRIDALEIIVNTIIVILIFNFLNQIGISHIILRKNKMI